MGSHNQFAELGAAKSVGEGILAPPANNGTIDLKGLDGALVLGNTANNENWLLPEEGDTSLNTIVYVSNSLGGTLTIKNQASTIVDTVSAGEVKGFQLSASRVWVANGGMSAAQEIQLSSLYTSETSTGRIPVPLTSITQEDGTVLAKQASTTSGWAQLAGKNVALMIPVNATNEAFAATTNLPPDVSGALNGELTLSIAVSKSADSDSLTFDAEIYARSDTYATWSPDAYTGSAVEIPVAGGVLQFPVATSPSVGAVGSAAFVITLGGVNDGDAVYIHDVYWTYRKKLVTG